MTLQVMNKYLAVGVDVGVDIGATVSFPPQPSTLLLPMSSPMSPTPTLVMDKKSPAAAAAAAAAPRWRALPPFQTTTTTQGDFNINASSSALNKTLAIYLPLILKELNGLSIPAMEGKNDGISWSTDATKVQHLVVGSASIHSVPNHGLSITLTGLGLSIPTTGFKISKKIIIHLGCSGHFSGTLSSTSVTMNLNVTRDATGNILLHFCVCLSCFI